MLVNWLFPLKTPQYQSLCIHILCSTWSTFCYNVNYTINQATRAWTHPKSSCQWQFCAVSYKLNLLCSAVKPLLVTKTEKQRKNALSNWRHSFSIKSYTVPIAVFHSGNNGEIHLKAEPEYIFHTKSERKSLTTIWN